MGNAYSFESLNPEKYEAVKLSDDGFFGAMTTVKFPFGGKPSSLRDDKLWQEFGKEIDELLVLLNKHLCLLLFVAPVMIMVAWFAAMAVLGDDNGEVGANSSTFVLGSFFVVVIFTIVFQAKIFSRNQQVDEQIHKICANYTRRFQEHGIVPQYRTKWTEMCKPKGARPLRMIVFIPAGNVTA